MATTAPGAPGTFVATGHVGSLREVPIGTPAHCYVQLVSVELYTSLMEIAVSVLRAELAEWIERARLGAEIIVTDRGMPVARLSAVESASVIDRLTRDGVLSKPSVSGRPTARGATRVRARGSVADSVSEQRR